MAIKRIKTGERMSQAVVHGGLVQTAGQVAKGAPGESVEAQTRDILSEIDKLLGEAGTDKSKPEMNGVWDAWVVAGEAPTRACVESRLASSDYKVEIAVTAALD